MFMQRMLILGKAQSFDFVAADLSADLIITLLFTKYEGRFTKPLHGSKKTDFAKCLKTV
jgi:hypothetical protein